MKTAISVPDELFRMAEAAARKMKISRSKLYAQAIAEFLERRRAKSITRRLNAVYADQPSKLDPALHRAQLKSMERNSW